MSTIASQLAWLFGVEVDERFTVTAGFDKDTSLKLINSTLVANTKEDMYATLDIQILDLFNGNMEFIKNV